MNDAPAAYVLAMAVLFARIGAIFMIAPGLSSMRAPVKVRLLIALGVTLALAPPLIDTAADAVSDRTPAALLRVLGMEAIIGLFIGLMTRLLMMALSTMAIAIANMVGLGGIPGTAIDGNEPSQAAASLFNVTALMIIFLTDLHHEILRAGLDSYAVVAPGGIYDAQTALSDVADRASEAFLVALRLSAPFIIYSVIVNFAIGLTNKLTPQLPVFFVALPMVTAGGLMMIAYAVREMMFAFRLAFEQLVVAL
ncbi:flagellar biosynthetic protein FliR [Acuticoccus sp. MNP-M23]|uniref:flagellar biosynthetic protein FliR n=1 Tax=Acuticoccus sp. MNP-M23 TaxID=3072793 RepID=UPI00281641B4|nr:flagellar biosynthetic protein FliR [Acuticoccus sp. MNP-M23]WMS41815.1 flagellar biosynthetic protein FliR [Acuticoccus sp. MNP-M23]